MDCINEFNRTQWQKTQTTKRHRFATLPVSLAILILTVNADADDLELRNLDTSGWPCLNQPSGTAKKDGIDRNLMKNRSMAKIPAKAVSDAANSPTR